MKTQKILTLVLSAAMIGSMMTGCGSASDSNSSTAQESVQSSSEQKSAADSVQDSAADAASDTTSDSSADTTREASETAASSASETESAAVEMDTNLVSTIAGEAANYVKNGDLSVYSEMDWTSEADTFPSKFDLRDRGVVPEVRSQGSWGTCWSFAAIAACEISQLSTLGWTTEQFKEETGYDMNLSERHLAWFGTSHLPTLDEYADGEYPFNEDQAGEGAWSYYEETDPGQAHFQGGMLGFASSIFANGIGPAAEADWPYQANDGSTSTASDWSIPETARYQIEAEMLNSSILPSPAQKDEDGNYVYNEAGTEAIKEELLNGRGVSIMYHADQNMSPDASYQIKLDLYLAQNFPQDVADILAGLGSHKIEPADATQDQKRALMSYYLLVNGMDQDAITDEDIDRAVEECYDDFANTIANPTAASVTTEKTAEQEAKERETFEKLGMDYDEEQEKMQLQIEANAGVYMNAETYAQYVDNENAQVDHGVTIVGWDDDYAVSNFPADHQPPAAGAWIVRNSWGSSYGDGGYFYLSYYDKSICFAESFEFVFDQNAEEGVGIVAYDNMEASAVCSAKFDTPVYMANVFPIEEESVLSYVSVMTTDLNTQVTANVYLLNEDYTSPTDGVLLETVTDTYEFAGYHRIALDYDYKLPAGSVISVVERQHSDSDSGKNFTVSYTNAISEDLANLMGSKTWNVGIINEGESFIRINDQWYDWKDVIDEVQASDEKAALVEFDNLNIKAYLYTVEGVEEAHDFGEPENYGGSEALICKDCGETMIIVNG